MIAAGEVMQLPKAFERKKKRLGIGLADTGREGGHVCKSHSYLCLSHMRRWDWGGFTHTHTDKGCRNYAGAVR